jgi:hypothetical protein
MPPRPKSPPASPETVRLSEPGEIAEALPHLLGFHPHESVVLVSLTGPGGRRVGLTVRADIPPPPLVVDVARALTHSVRTDDPDAVLVAVVSEAPDVPGGLPEPGGGGEPDGVEFGAGPDLPHRHLVHELVLALAAEAVPVREALLVRRGRWWSYDCPHPCCAPGAGTALPDGTSELAAASVLAGAVLAGSRAELEARIARTEGPDRELTGAACLRYAGARGTRAAEVGWAVVADEARTAIEDAVACRRPGGLAAAMRLAAEDLARIVWGLRDTAVRDRALGFALTDDAAAAEALWTECTRRAPAPLDAAPATLLAVSAWLRGDGAMANVALDRALDSDPGYALARLLSQGLAACLTPAELRWMIAGSADQLDEPA